MDLIILRVIAKINTIRDVGLVPLTSSYCCPWHLNESVQSLGSRHMEEREDEPMQYLVNSWWMKYDFGGHRDAQHGLESRRLVPASWDTSMQTSFLLSARVCRAPVGERWVDSRERCWRRMNQFLDESTRSVYTSRSLSYMSRLTTADVLRTAQIDF